MAKPFKPGFFSNLNGIKDNNDRPPLVGGSGGGTTNTFTNLGTGARVFAALVGDDVQFRTITVGPNLAVNETADNVNITFTGTLGEVNTMSNLGTTGARVFSAKTGVNFALRRIIAAANSGITVTENTNDISIGTNPSVLATLLAPLLGPLLTLGEANTASNLGAGEGVFAQKTGVDLQFKSLVAGTNVTLTSDANTITINSTGGGGGPGPVGSGGDEKAARFTNLQDQTLTSGTFTILDYDDVVTNNAPTVYTNNGAGRVTVTETGFYTLTAGLAIQASLLSAVSTTALAIFRNGEAVAAETNSQTLAVGETRIHTCSTSIQLNAGDIIDARAYVLSALGVGNILALLLPFLFGQNATQINHLSLVKQETGGAMGGQNLGSGTGEVFKQVTGGDTFQFRTLRAGANVTITQDANEVTVSASGGGGGGGLDLNKQFYYDDLEALDNTNLAQARFTSQTSGAGAQATNLLSYIYTQNNIHGCFYLESGTTGTGFAQIRSNQDPGGGIQLVDGVKVAGYCRGFIETSTSPLPLVAMTLYATTSSGLRTSTSGSDGAYLQLGFALGGTEWFLLQKRRLTEAATVIPLVGVPVPGVDSIFDCYVVMDDTTKTATYTIKIDATTYTGTANFPNTLASIQGAVNNSGNQFYPYRFGLYNEGAIVESRIVADAVGYGFDFTNCSDAYKRLPITF